MRIGKRTTYSLLLACTVLSIAVRYPQTPHGVGVDSFSFAVLSNAILEQGRAAWIVHPLSMFGLYPLSYPSGSFFLTAGFAATGGLGIEATTLILSLFVGAFGVPAAFVMAREFRRNDVFSLVVALVFALMPKFVTNTLWEVPARGFFMVLTLVFLWTLLRTAKSPEITNVVLATLVFLLLSTFHRLAVLMVVVFTAFLVTMIFVVAAHVARREFPRILLSPAFQRKSRLVGLFLFGAVILALVLGTGVLHAYDDGAFFSGGTTADALGNLAVSLTRSVGILSPLAIVGITVVLFARNKGPSEYLFLSTPLAIIPTLFLRSYTGYYVVAFFALFIGMGCTFILTGLRGKLRALAVGSLLVVVAAGAYQAIVFEVPRQTFMSESEYSAGLYAKYGVQGTIACNDGLLGSRIASITGAPYLPIGGATTSLYGPDAMAFGFVKGFQTVPVPIQDLTVDSDAFFLPIGVRVGDDWSYMFANGLASPLSERVATRYNVSYVCEDSTDPGRYHTGWGVDYGSPLLRDIYQQRYKTYDSGPARIWLAFSP